MQYIHNIYGTGWLAEQDSWIANVSSQVEVTSLVL